MKELDFQNILRGVKSLQPGQRINFEKKYIEGDEIADRIMENIMGASYEFFYTKDLRGEYVFGRLKEPLNDGLMSFVSEDRRHLFSKLPNGLWSFKKHG